MTRSASTPRLRLTLLWYLALLVLTCFDAAAAEPGSGTALRHAAAVLLVGAAVLGRIWCSVWIAGRKDAELVTAGPYALCRHPLYALSLLGGLGLGAATGSMLLTAVTLLLLLTLFAVAIRSEERRLEERHGERWLEYRRRTPQLWPRLSGYAVPECCELRPRVYWKAFVDGGSMLLLLALLLAAPAIRLALGWPAFWRLG